MRAAKHRDQRTPRANKSALAGRAVENAQKATRPTGANPWFREAHRITDLAFGPIRSPQITVSLLNEVRFCFRIAAPHDLTAAHLRLGLRSVGIWVLQKQDLRNTAGAVLRKS